MTATVTLSIEIELAWGHHDRSPERRQPLSKDRHTETEALRRLLSRCDTLKIPLTFDVVGHLLHEQCDGYHDGPHPDGWFDADPGTDVETHPHFYAPDLVEYIRAANVNHEICTHTYSHVLCNEMERTVVDWELERASGLHETFGLESPRSFVPPRHQLPPTEVLRAHGIRVVRRIFEDYGPDDVGKMRKFLWMLLRSHPRGWTRPSDGIVETGCTPHPSLTADFLPNGQQPPHPAFRVIPMDVRQRLHERYLVRALDSAIQHDGDLHLWTHLYNLSNESQWQPVMSFLDNLTARQDQGEVTINTMDSLSLIAHREGKS